MPYYPNSLDVAQGDIIRLSGSTVLQPQNYTTSILPASFCSLGGTKVKVYGNIMSLVGWKTQLKNYEFFRLFYPPDSMDRIPQSYVDASKLLLPSGISEFCYCRMFDSCSGLVQAPTIPASFTVIGAGNNMFRYCSQLSSITVTFTSWGENSYNWVEGVAAHGTFHCPENLPHTTFSNDRIPNGWTVETF